VHACRVVACHHSAQPLPPNVIQPSGEQTRTACVLALPHPKRIPAPATITRHTPPTCDSCLLSLTPGVAPACAPAHAAVCRPCRDIAPSRNIYHFVSTDAGQTAATHRQPQTYMTDGAANMYAPEPHQHSTNRAARTACQQNTQTRLCNTLCNTWQHLTTSHACTRHTPTHLRMHAVARVP
jgi:hypothetical protein